MNHLKAWNVCRAAGGVPVREDGRAAVCVRGGGVLRRICRQR